ncbi:MAG TPA: small basic family protein [Actinomycetota bacterium]|nr:small basic family protein [Actinomycetota bacterium]
MIALVALLIGIVAGLLLEPTLPAALAPYLPVVVVAALDTVLEGARARFEGGYQEGEFIVAFLANTLLAAFVVWVGDRLGAPDLRLGVIVVFGVRMFQSLAAIRRHVFRE